MTGGAERSSSDPAAIALAAVERIRHIQDSQDQILVLAFRPKPPKPFKVFQKSLKPFKVFPVWHTPVDVVDGWRGEVVVRRGPVHRRHAPVHGCHRVQLD